MIGIPGMQHTCHASFKVSAGWSPLAGAAGTISVFVHELEAPPPYQACICFSDLRVRVTALVPGVYRVHHEVDARSLDYDGFVKVP